MGDSFTGVSHRSLGDNLIESIKGLLVGIVMFFGAFPLLWMNEGCVDLSTVAKTAVVLKPEAAGTTGEGKLVAVTADLKVDEAVADPELLVADRYAMLRRKVEMYAWSETKETSTKKKLGGGSDTVTTYSYELGWTSSPKTSSSFAHPEGHQNPGAGIEARSFFPAHARVGAFSFSPAEIELPPASPLALSASMLKAQDAPAAAPTAPSPVTPVKGPAGKKGKTSPAPAPVKAPPAPDATAPSGSAYRYTGAYLFRGKGSVERPELGDVRVSYEAVLPGKQVTLYGQRQGSSVVPYLYEGKDKLFRVVPGTHEQAMALLHGEHVTQTWIVRLCGFLAMWLGLSLALGPFNAVLDIVPFVGSAGRFVTGLAMFPAALVLSFVTIVVAIVAHSTVLLVLTVLLVVGGITALVVVKKRNAPAAPPPGGYGGPPMGGYGGGPPMGGYGPPPGRG